MNTFQDSVLTAFSLITTLDPVLAGIVLRSLAVSACACVLACSLGLVLGAWLGVARFAGRGVLAQCCQRRVMAGVKHQHVGIVVKGHGQCALDVAAQGFNLRRQARLSLALGLK